MAFTYEPGNEDVEVKVVTGTRRRLGDTQLGRGVLPHGRNLEDEVILAAIGAGGGGMGELASQIASSWLGAVGQGEVSKAPGLDIADRWSKTARSYGGGGSSGSYRMVSAVTEA